MDYSLLADWVSGIGSLLAVAVALWFSIRDAQDRQKEKYASLTVWTEYDPANEMWQVIVVNGTEQPFFTWTCHITYMTKSGEEGAEDFGYQDAGILPPGRSSYPWIPMSAPMNESEIRVSLKMMDALGRFWQKPPTGQIKRLRRKQDL